MLPLSAAVGWGGASPLCRNCDREGVVPAWCGFLLNGISLQRPSATAAADLAEPDAPGAERHAASTADRAAVVSRACRADPARLWQWLGGERDVSPARTSVSAAGSASGRRRDCRVERRRVEPN